MLERGTIAIDQAREFVDHRLGYVGNYGEAAGHVAVQSAIAAADFGFVARAQNQRAEFIRERHQQIAADAGLEIFFGGVFGAFGEDIGEGFAIAVKYGADRQDDKPDAEIGGELARVANAAFGGIRAGHGDAGDVFAAEGGDGNAGDDGGIDSAAEPHERFLESAFMHVVTGAGDQRLERERGFIGGLRTQVAGAADGVEDDDVFFECARLGGDAAIGRERDT